jgi:methylphosphotriester-DNA--protein-cysteine methyltransferase
MPLRPYWCGLRLQRTAVALAAGHTVTEAAYIAGFADGPHLTHTVRWLLGITSRDLMARCRQQTDWVAVDKETCAAALAARIAKAARPNGDEN